MRWWPPDPCPACHTRRAEADGLCGACWQLIDAQPGLSGAALLALGPYRGALGAALRAMKYRPSKAIAHALGQRLAVRIMEAWPGLQHPIVVPLPGDPRRRRQRGFDHTEALARGLLSGVERSASGRRFTIAPLLLRCRTTTAQSRVDPHTRQQNVALSMRARLAPVGAQLPELLMVDDIITSAASAREAQRALLEAGWPSTRLAVVAFAQPLTNGAPKSPSGHPVSTPTMVPTRTWG
jgi:predicted amidophosphoribosyltransferase